MGILMISGQVPIYDPDDLGDIQELVSRACVSVEADGDLHLMPPDCDHDLCNSLMATLYVLTLPSDEALDYAFEIRVRVGRWSAHEALSWAKRLVRYAACRHDKEFGVVRPRGRPRLTLLQ